jgi:excisionase family DNA binding protein
MTSESPSVLTVGEAARQLRISRGLAYELIRQGKLPALRLGRTWRVPTSALAAFLSETQNGGRDSG